MHINQIDVAITFSHLFRYHRPWHEDDLRRTDYRDINAYLIKMTEGFLAANDGTEWQKHDLLDAANNYLLSFIAQNPPTFIC